MEAVGAGASIITFVTVALGTAKYVHDYLSWIKDGPPKVAATADTILHFHFLLERIKQRGVTDNDAILLHDRRFCTDLDEFATKIVKLQIRPGEWAGGKLWKRFRVLISEKDLDVINQTMSRHCIFLNSYLTAAMSDVISAALNDSRDEVNRSQELATREVVSSIHNLGRDFNSGMNHVINATESLLTAMELSAQRSIKDASSIARRDTLIADQLSQILAQLKINETQEFPTESGVIGEVDDQGSIRETDADDDDPAPDGLEERLLEVLERLSRLVSEEQLELHIFDEENTAFDSIIENLGSILDAARHQSGSVAEIETGGCRRDIPNADNAQRMLQQFGKTFGRNGFLLNPKERMPLWKRKRPSGLDEYDDSSYRIGMTTGSILLHRKKRLYKRSRIDEGGQTVGTGSSISEETSGSGSRADYSTTVTFMPQDIGKYRMLVAQEFASRSLQCGGVTSISYLAVNPVLPMGSEIFRTVRTGRVQELREMLQDGKASLRTCDEMGGSLLFYCTRQPEMCRFLLDHGLDVDHVGCYGDPESPYRGTAFTIEGNGNEMDPSEIPPVFECREMLLMAGSDLLAEFVYPFYGLMYKWSLDHLAVEPRANFAHLARKAASVGLISLTDIANHRGDDGFTLLHSACQNIGGSSLENVSSIFSLGIDINAVDNSGRNCLSLFVHRMGSPYYSTGIPWVLREQQILIFLLENGADPNIIDRNGSTASQFAYERDLRPHHRVHCDLGSYYGDVWDSALQFCGYDISEYRVTHFRVATYTRQYRRCDFNLLWRGRESLCPYWDDRPWLQGFETTQEPDNDTNKCRYNRDCVCNGWVPANPISNAEMTDEEHDHGYQGPRWTAEEDRDLIALVEYYGGTKSQMGFNT